MLDAYQSAAAHTADGAYLILAGPGSGKTTMLMERVLYLLEEKHIPPEKLVLITFTRDAACEMEKRFSSRIGRKKTGVTFSTFHSFFFRILKSRYEYRTEQILYGKPRRVLMHEVLRGMGEEVSLEEEGYFELLEKELSRFENSRIPAIHVDERSRRFPFRQVFCPAV